VFLGRQGVGLLVAGFLLAGCGARFLNPAPTITLGSQTTVGRALAFCKARPLTRGRPARLRGYYVEYPIPSAGPAVYGELVTSPAETSDVLDTQLAPALMTFGIALAVPELGSDAVSPAPQTRSWVSVLGTLSCINGDSPAEMTVQNVLPYKAGFERHPFTLVPSANGLGRVERGFRH
jgi:hypothetical protein